MHNARGPRSILVLEDETSIRLAIEFQLEELGHVATCQSAPEACEYVKLHRVDVLVTDLRIGTDHDAGIELVSFTKKHSPNTQVVVLSVRDDSDAIVRCVRAGALHYIVKPWSHKQLQAVVKRALDLSQATIDRDSLVERLILADWDLATTSIDKHIKGNALEALCSQLFGTVSGWHRIEGRVKTKTEEIDLVIQNEAADEFWRRFGSFILLECKNWHGQKKPGRPDFDSFYAKITRRGKSDCRLGFFVSLSGVARTFHAEVARIAKEEIVVVVLDQRSLWALVCANDRSDYLKELVGRTLMT